MYNIMKRSLTIIKTLDERVEELEQRVRELESIVKHVESREIINDQLKTQAPVSQSHMSPSQVAQEPIQQDLQPKSTYQGYTKPQYVYQGATKPQFIYQGEKKSSSKEIKETIVGKYFIGALAALLVFIAAISLIGLVWDELTPFSKLLLISTTGTLLTVFGFWLIRSKKNSVNAIILGTGSGLLFISILSADMAFNLISHNIAILLCCIWSIFFILSSRFINVFFTTIIAYIGSYIALSFGLTLLSSDSELLILTLFASVISAVMIYNAFKNKVNHQLIASLLLSLLSFSTITLRTIIDGILLSDQILKYCFTQTIVIIIIYILMNVLYRIVDRKKYSWTIGVALITATLTALYFINLYSNYIVGLEFEAICIFFFIVNFVQIIINHLILKETYKRTTLFYVFVLVCTSVLINITLFDVLTGVIIVAFLLMIIDSVTKQNDYVAVTSFVILFDVASLFTSNEIVLSNAVYGVIQIALIASIIYKNYKIKNYEHINLLKIAGVATVLINSFFIPKHFIGSIMIDNQSLDLTIIRTIGYIIAVVSFALLFKINYFHDWDREAMNDNGLSHGIHISKNMRTLFLFSSTVLYFIGLNGISDSSIWYQQLIFTLSTIIMAFIQTYYIIQNSNETNQLSEIWIGIKYLVLSWTIFDSFFSLGINSVAYSIIGLIIAILSISFGFRFQFKSLRLYGLILTIIMVIKFILIDLSEENSITRVISLIIGGLICFGISVIYNKLNTKIED